MKGGAKARHLRHLHPRLPRQQRWSGILERRASGSSAIVGTTQRALRTSFLLRAMIRISTLASHRCPRMGLARLASTASSQAATTNSALLYLHRRSRRHQRMLSVQLFRAPRPPLWLALRPPRPPRHPQLGARAKQASSFGGAPPLTRAAVPSLATPVRSSGIHWMEGCLWLRMTGLTRDLRPKVCVPVLRTWPALRLRTRWALHRTVNGSWFQPRLLCLGFPRSPSALRLASGGLGSLGGPRLRMAGVASQPTPWR
mmetsp:Transcript_36244/g.84981  ORF Transcript_36244/g.84981 Transcript_36244/m.84981 type:complete len:257 (+) Transcript_36244:443-1213(+)